MWESDYKESWVPRNWCFWTVVLEKTLESPLVCKVIKPVHPKGNQSWIFIGRTDAEAEIPILWPCDSKSQLIGKDSDAGKDWRQEEKGMTKDEVVGWHHQLDGHEFEQAPGVGDGQGSLVCYSPWGRRVGHNWATELNWLCIYYNEIHININLKWFCQIMWTQVGGKWRWDELREFSCIQWIVYIDIYTLPCVR